MTTVDAVVIGAGPNGLVAANDLADHGGRLTFRGKAAHPYDATIDDPKVARVVRRLQDLPGQLLFQYVDDTGDTHTIGSTEVNEFLQTHGSSTATAKTFCTWGASVMGAALLAHSPMPTTSREQSWVVNDAIRVVADRLGNTLAVCRSSYVHPRVYETFNTGELANRWTCQAPREPRGLSADERRFWELLGRHACSQRTGVQRRSSHERRRHASGVGPEARRTVAA